MAFKVVVFATLLAAVYAAPAHSGEAVSHISISHGHSEQQHGGYSHEAPALHTYHAPAVHTYSAPVVAKVAVAPVVAAPVYAHHHHEEEEHYAPAHYQFEYSVHDPHNHDIKEQKEHREGDVVKGMYSLVEADGSKRIVEYTADKHNGFNAVVHREPATHPAPVKVAKIAAPVAISAPIHYHEQPSYYHH